MLRCGSPSWSLFLTKSICYLELQLSSESSRPVVSDPTTAFDPVSYWANRVDGRYDLSSVGQISLGAYNSVAYRIRLRAMKRVLKRVFPQWPSVSILESAFGIGFYLNYYAAEGVADVSGVDVSEQAVAAARVRFPDYHLLSHDLSNPLPFNREFDLVSTIDVLYHIVDDAKWESALTNLSRAVGPGGYLLFTEKFPPERPVRVADHVKRRPLADYSSVLSANGLTIERVEPVFVFMDTPAPDAHPRWLATISYLQWQFVQRSLSFLRRAPGARDIAGVVLATIQYPWENLALSLLRRTPNTEMVIARRPY